MANRGAAMRHWMLGLALAILPQTAPAACRLALVLAMDVSRSVSPTDFRIGRDGLAAAMRDAEVRRAFLAGGPVAVTVFDWDEPARQAVVLPWRMIRTPADLDSAAGEIEGWRRPADVGLTGTAAALLFARAALDAGPACDRAVIDVATDGLPNAGPRVSDTYAGADFGRVTVNALAIGEHEDELVAWLAAELIHGPGAFIEFAPRHTDFPEAIRRKLIREVSLSLFGSLAPP